MMSASFKNFIVAWRHALRSRCGILRTGILVAPGDVGHRNLSDDPRRRGSIGASTTGILVIEQPELHVHPAIQVGIGDLFIQAAGSDPDRLSSGKTLIIETHSEHIMLRLLRRIRETTDDELPPGVAGLTPENLSVIYVESADEGVQFRSLPVDADGEFLDRWPRGFFEERAEELF